MLEEIEHTASQVVGSNIEAANSVGTTLVDQHPGQQRMYPRGTVVSPRYANSQLSPRYTLNSQMSPPADFAVHGGMNNTYRNPYSGVQPLKHLADGRSQPRSKIYPWAVNRIAADHCLVEVYSTPQTHRHRAPGTTSIGLPNVQGLVAGTPRGTPKGASRVNTDLSKGHLDPRQPQKPPIRFSGVGLGPGVAGLGGSRHTINDTGATNYDSFSAPSISSRGKNQIST